MHKQIGLYGLGVMGQSLARNIANKGFSISVFNIETDVTKACCQKYPLLHGYENIADFVDSLEKPRKILLMVTAGKVVDSVISSLVPLLSQGDILMDCGNSFFLDTERRQQELKEVGIRYIGCGVSGGEKGALEGPSIMPGGDRKAYAEVASIVTAMAAQNDDGSACCTYIGEKGAGHFVKMVHNGIEYADMQLIAESYALLKNYYQQDMKKIQMAFHRLAQGPLNSYLMDITCDILRRKDDKKEGWLVNYVSDVARQKGTGKWTSQISFDYSVAIPSLTEAVQTRFLSMNHVERTQASALYPHASCKMEITEEAFLQMLEKAMLAAKMSIYAQGFSLITSVSKQKEYHIDCIALANIWQNGCIIKSAFLKDIMQAFKEECAYDNLILSSVYQKKLSETQHDLQNLVSLGVLQSLHLPIFTSALQYMQGITCATLPTNLIQAQRDCFGAHTYERTDAQGSFHSDWQA
ncbi:MAG: NADP-dependent phosphogluconate dehydrogenase [Longicatena caecimuris]|uniref:NADP-dependent phosphogluconate dehydrogenase n=1 Tax=Longicatena caecimuris TaxID=1796635 RepID=UPI00399BCC02